ncbi:MAG: FecR domain-containing protein [Rhodothermales bacterium]
MTAYGLMDVTLESILHTDEWTDDTVETVRRALADQPELARQVWLWVQVSDRAGCRLDAIMPPLDDLMALAMDRSGRRLDADMHLRLGQCRTSFGSACASHPALNAIVDRMAEDVAAFDIAWSRSRKAQPATVRSWYGRVAASVPRMAAAAVAVVALLVVGYLVLQDTSQVLTAPVDGVRMVALEDGSQVRLVEGASLWTSRSNPRDVSLEGRAFFDVAPRADAPFSVRSGDVITTVVGTTFGLEALPDETRISVVTGSVRVEAAGQDVWLDAGLATRVPNGGVPETPYPFEAMAEMDWTGLFIFRNTPIDSVAATLSRSFNVRIEVDKPLSGRDLTGTFDREQGLDEILGVVAAAVGAELDVEERGTRYRLLATRP